MIYLYTNIFNSTNEDYIYENPQKNSWALIKNGVIITDLPTKKDLLLYRQCFFANEALVWLANRFEVPIDIPNLFYTLAGYATDKNKDSMFKISQQILNNSAHILIYFDTCNNKNDEEYTKLVEDFKLKYPDDFADRIFVYSKVVADSNLQKQIIDKILGQENK